MMRKKVLLFIVATLMLVLTLGLLVACSNTDTPPVIDGDGTGVSPAPTPTPDQGGNNGGGDDPVVGPGGGGTSQPVEPDQNARIESIVNGEVSGVECTLEVSPSTEYIDLSGSITVSEGCSWQLYEDVLGQVNIPTKYAANLVNGYNTYYIVVTSADGKTNRTYTLNIWRNFYVDIMFVVEGEVVKTLTRTTHTYISNDEFISVSRTGYTHTGWTNHTDGEDYYITGYNSSYSALSSTITFDAKFSANDYTITLDANGGSCGKDSVEVTYDSYFELPVPTRTGYTFDGWEYNGTKITTTSGSCITGFAYDKNITAKAKWSINSYQLTVNKDGNYGSVTSSGSRQYNSSVTITATPNAGYTFAGWYSGNTKVSDNASYTFTMPANDVTYTAIWEINAEMQNFEFTSTTTTCTIIGVKDTTLTSITIPDSVTTIGSNAFSGCSSLTSITIPDSVTTIGSKAFSGCSSLTSIVIPDSVTTIGSNAFYNCSSLTSITLPFVGATKNGTGNTHLAYIFNISSYDDHVFYIIPSSLKEVIITGSTTIGKYAFSGFSSLTSITIPDSVTTIGDYAFRNCTSLTSIVIPDSVTSIGVGSFQGCSGLTSITLPFVGATKDGTSNTHFGYIFGTSSYSNNADYVSSSLKEVIITGSTTIGKYAFAGCNSLTSVTIPDSVTTIGSSAFSGCASLTSVTIGDSVTTIGSSAFSGCASLTSIVIPDSVTTIGSYAFYVCTSLTSITLPFVGATKDGTSNTHFGYIFGASHYSYNGDYVPSSLKEVIITGSTTIGSYAFYECTSLTSIEVDEDNPKYRSIDGNLYSKDGKTLIQYAVGKTSKSFIIPDSVTTIGSYAFYGCDGLTSVTYGANSQLTSIGSNAFSGCSSLTSVVIPDSVTTIGLYAFYECTSLTSIVIPDSVTSIGWYAFWNCRSLTSISVDENNPNYKSIDGNLYSKDGKTLIQYAIGKTATSFVIPDSVTTIYSAFRDCTSLTSVTFGENSQLTTIGSNAFYNCSSLTSIVIPDSVTTISSYAFFGCKSLTSIVIPDSVTTIDHVAFYECTSLTDVYYTGTKEQWNAISIGSDNSPLTRVTRRYYSECVHDNNQWRYDADGNISTELTVGDWIVDVEATCTTNGSRHKECTICHATLKTDVIPTLGHDIVEHNAQAPTCTDIGWEAYETCSRCDHTTYVEIPALGHDKVGHEAQAPTCTDIGWEAYETCSRCDYTTYTTIPATGHTPAKAVQENVVAATCTTTGSYDSVVYCDTCGKELSRDAKTVDALGHDVINHEAQAPTCTEFGWNAYETCSRCGYSTYVEITATGHSYSAAITAPTCTTDGYTTHTCHCGDSYVDTYIKASGAHNFQESDTCKYCSLNIADVAVDRYNMSATVDDNVIGYVVACADGKYDAYIKGTGAMKDYSNESPFSEDNYSKSIVNVYIQSGITSIGSNAFYWCYNLPNITIPSSVISIGENAFAGCGSLTSITIPSNVTSIGYGAFLDCYNLRSIVFEGAPQIQQYAFDGTAYYEDANNWENKVLYIGNCLIKAKTTIETCTIKEGTTIIADGAFSDCDSLTNITIPDSVTSIGSNAFAFCSSLTSITIPDSVTNIGGGVFDGCTNIVEATMPTTAISCIPKDKLKTVVLTSGTSIEAYAFNGCTNLTSITIPDSVTSISEYAFYECGSLTNVYYTGDIAAWCGITFEEYFANPMWYASNLYVNGELVEGELVIPNGVTTIPTVAFYGCSSLTSIVIPDSVTTIGNYAFYCCTGLTSVTFGENSQLISIGDNSFQVCISLTSVTIPDSVSIIGIGAFGTCSSLTNVTIGSGVTSIDGNAFLGCNSLTDVYYAGTEEKWNSISIDSGNESLTNATIHFYTVVNENVVEATCSTTGSYESVTYSYNGEELSRETIVVPALGHDIVNQEAQAPTCTEVGWEAYEACSRCDYTTRTEIPASHIVVNHEAQAPTCTEVGWEAYEACSRCDYSTYVEIPATGHNFENNENCSICSAEYYTEGLQFSLVDEEYYNVTGISTSATDITIPSVYQGLPVVKIAASAFSANNNILTVTIPDSVTSIGMNAFKDCNELTNVYYLGTLEQWCGITFANLTNTYANPMSYADNLYIDGELLTEAVIPNTVTNINSYAFYNCNSLTNVEIPDSVTSIGRGAFGGCSSLESITIPFVGAKAGVTGSDTYQYPFGYIFGTTSYTGGVATIQEYYGSSTSSTTSTTYYIPSSLKSVTVTGGYIPRGAFENCNNITNITLGDDVTTIGDYAFEYCRSLTSITIHSSVTSIGSDAFNGCSGLTSITIPDSVVKIGKGAFSGCSNLTSITFEDTTAWYSTTNFTQWLFKTGGTEMDVTDASTNATCFTSTYADYYWYKA